MPAVPAFGRLRKKYPEFKACLEFRTKAQFLISNEQNSIPLKSGVLSSASTES